MACYHPLRAWRSKEGRSPTTGKWGITFEAGKGYADSEFTIPCGRCIGCRLEHSRQWAIRMVHEASLYDSNCFVTLTYDEDNLPSNGSLNKRDIQLFLKKLRKEMAKYGYDKIRYFQCGEYGEKLGRPHHHVCFFNLDFPDRILFTKIAGNNYYSSETLERIWGKGHVLLGELTFETAAYTARYCTKKITGKNAQEYYGGKLPEYVTMSRRSGIGKEYWQRFKSDIIVGDSIIVKKGLILKPTKYYDSLYDIENPQAFEEVKKKRMLYASKIPEYEKSRKRLEQKEKLKKLKFKQLKRSYENA